MTCADRLAHGTCKMSHTRIDRDDAVHEVQQCNRIAEVSQIVPEECDATVLPKHCNALFSDVLLQAYPVSICSENRKTVLPLQTRPIRGFVFGGRPSSSQSLAALRYWDSARIVSSVACSASGKLNNGQ